MIGGSRAFVPTDAWHFEVLGMTDPSRPGKLRGYFDFIREHHDRTDGDILEVGVYRGASLLATALLLQELGSDKKVIGFDSFSGFPGYHANDELDRFEDLARDGRVSAEHIAAVRLNRRLRSAVAGRQVDAGSISSSGNFSRVARSELETKIELLGLENIKLVEGEFAETMVEDGRRYSAVLMDCDLYESHRVALGYCWPRLSDGGFVFLDEYYSLKFPGARIAIDEFCASRGLSPQMHECLPGEFERWSLRKAMVDLRVPA